MSASNKALIAFIAVVAFVVGAAIKLTRVSDDVDTQTLLQAELSVHSIENETGEAQYTPDSIKNLLGDKLTLVNFWASWCAPCREEMPLFEAMYQRGRAKGFQVVGIAIDSPDNAKPMLDSMGITYPILYAQQTGMTVMQSAGNPQGLLPFTLLLDENGEMIDHVLGLVHEKDILTWLSNAGIDPSSAL